MPNNLEAEKIIHSAPIPVSGVERHPTPIIEVPVVASGPNSPASLSPLLQATRLGSPASTGSKPRQQRSSSFGSLIDRIKGNGGNTAGKRTGSTDTSIKGSKQDDSVIDEEDEEDIQTPGVSNSGLPESRKQGVSGAKPKVSIFGFSNKQDKPEGESPKVRIKKSSPGWLQKVLKPSTNGLASNTGSPHGPGPSSPPESTVPSSSASRPDNTASSWETIITLPAKTAVATWAPSLKPSTSSKSDQKGQDLAVPTDPSWLPLAEPVPFDREAVMKRVQKRYEVLCNIGLGVNIVTSIGQAAGGDLIGQCFVAVQNMWAMIQKIGLVETSAWRLVERCIDLLIAVDTSVKEIEKDGHTIGADMRTSVTRLTG